MPIIILRGGIYFPLRIFYLIRINVREGDVVENKRFRINQFIRVPEVRLIDSDGNQVGIVKTNDALSMAQAKGLDLVEISPMAKPPVCKIINFSKFKYDTEKKEKEARKKQRISHLKEVRIRPRIGEHDLEVKIKHAREFIEHGDKVQLTAMFSGREMQHKELGIKIMDRIKDSLADIAEPEGRTSSMGTRVFLTLAPKKKTNSK
ncbi:MAG: translation initiation factor IF-3 [Endomicrobia bacterium]|nr:translation initiation factor IF-3 [Endomicrobiia bacterium]